MTQIIFAKIFWAKAVNRITQSATRYVTGNPNGSRYGMISFVEIKRRNQEIIGIDYSTQQNTNKDKVRSKRKEKKKLFLTRLWSHTEVEKIYSGLWKITFLSKKHFLLLQLHDSLCGTAVSFCTCNRGAIYYILLTWILFIFTHTDFKHSQFTAVRKNMYVCAAPGDPPGYRTGNI